jgi:hypothetical protein
MRGHLDVARWLVTDAGSDVRLERDNVSCSCSCRSSCAPGLTMFVLGIVFCSGWLVSPSSGM